MASLSTRDPSTDSRAGKLISAPSMAIDTTATPPYANERRKYSGKISKADSATATMSPLNATVRPAVCTVRAIACSVPSPAAISSRNRETMSRL
jgi:hypothetical protein